MKGGNLVLVFCTSIQPSSIYYFQLVPHDFEWIFSLAEWKMTVLDVLHFIQSAVNGMFHWRKCFMSLFRAERYQLCCLGIHFYTHSAQQKSRSPLGASSMPFMLEAAEKNQTIGVIFFLFVLVLCNVKNQGCRGVTLPSHLVYLWERAQWFNWFWCRKNKAEP